MSEHTPEPWETKGTRSDSVGREHIYICGQHINSGPVLTVCLVAGQMVGPAAQEANARRIVACVNACKEVSTEALEAGVVEEMVKSLEKIAQWSPVDDDGAFEGWAWCCDEARIALAKIRP